MDFFDQLMHGINFIADYIWSIGLFFKELPTIIEHWAVWAAKWALYAWIEIQIFTVDFAGQVARSILADFQIYNLLSSAFNGMDEKYRALAFAFKIPDCIRIIVDAFATRLVLTFMGW